MLLVAVATGGSKRGPGGPCPLATWASTQNALKLAIFRLKIEKIFGETPASFPLHKSQRIFQHACFVA